MERKQRFFNLFEAITKISTNTINETFSFFQSQADAMDNLNEISNEISDAVLFSNYFVYGIGVFDINEAGQIAATDVNADGLTLSVADLVYMVRIILGDAAPYPKEVVPFL